MVNKLEETEKRRQDIVSKRDAEIEAKKGTEDEDDLLLQDLASNMMKKGKLKYAIDRQGKLGSGSQRKTICSSFIRVCNAYNMLHMQHIVYLEVFEPEKVLIQQTEGIQRGDVKFFGFLAIVFIYLLFFYDKRHFWFIQYGRNYIRKFADRIHHAIEGRYDPYAKYEL